MQTKTKNYRKPLPRTLRAQSTLNFKLPIFRSYLIKSKSFRDFRSLRLILVLSLPNLPAIEAFDMVAETEVIRQSIPAVLDVKYRCIAKGIEEIVDIGAVATPPSLPEIRHVAVDVGAVSDLVSFVIRSWVLWFRCLVIWSNCVLSSKVHIFVNYRYFSVEWLKDWFDWGKVMIF